MFDSLATPLCWLQLSHCLPNWSQKAAAVVQCQRRRPVSEPLPSHSMQHRPRKPKPPHWRPNLELPPKPRRCFCLPKKKRKQPTKRDTQPIKHIKRLKQSTQNSRRLQKQRFPLGGRCKTQPINSPQNWRKILRLIKNRKSTPRMIISNKWKRSKWAPGTREHVGLRRSMQG